MPGGVFIGYVATTPQLSELVEALRERGGFTEPRAWESLVRDWHAEGLAVRPDHRMIAHTAFLVSARKLAPGRHRAAAAAQAEQGRRGVRPAPDSCRATAAGGTAAGVEPTARSGPGRSTRLRQIGRPGADGRDWTSGPPRWRRRTTGGR